MLEARGKRLREPALQQLFLRPFHVVSHTPEACPTRAQVEHQVGGPGVAVARLADGSGVQEPAVGRAEIRFGSLRCHVAVEGALREGERERDVAVADEHELFGSREQGGGSHLAREDVLPDGIARARVVEADALARPGRLERAKEGLGLGLERCGRPACARRGVRREEVEVQVAQHRQIVVSHQAHVGPLGDEAAARVRARAIPYEVPEAPELVRLLVGDRLEDGLEGMQVSVDVRDDAGSHRGRATLAKSATAVFAGAAWLGCALLLARTTVPDLDLPDLDAGRLFSADELARADRFRAVTRALWVGSVALELLALTLVVWHARPLARRARAIARGRVRTGVALGLVAVAAGSAATLPLGATRHWWNRRYGLSEQGYAAWLGDWALSVTVRALLVSLAVAGVAWLAGRLGSRWWLAAAPALAVLAAGFVLVQPLVVQPLFNRFEPLPDRALAGEVRRLGDEIGVEVETVQVADASRRTTTANAYVAGIGPTRRVVFFDTILDGRFSADELASVAAHELAHVARRHVWKGVAWFVLISVPGLALVAWVTGRQGGLRDPALVPLGLLVALAVSLATLPLQNAASRRYEAEADWVALRATGDPDASIGLDQRLAQTSLGDPDPPAWAKLLFSTHPPTLERIAMAEAFRTYDQSP